MELNISSSRVQSMPAKSDLGWNVWRKKARFFSSGQFGVAELRLGQQPIVSELVDEIRSAAKVEFGGRWYRGAGFGTVIRLPSASKDLLAIFDHIDLRNRLDGNIWQWIALVFEQEQAAIAMHMWYHGYLHPVFLEIVETFSQAGYDVIATDTQKDPLIQKLEKVHKTLDPINWLNALLR